MIDGVPETLDMLRSKVRPQYHHHGFDDFNIMDRFDNGMVYGFQGMVYQKKEEATRDEPVSQTGIKIELHIP